MSRLLKPPGFPPVDAGPLDLRPVLRLLRGGRLRLLLPCLPERSGVVLPPVGLEEPHSHTCPKASPKDPGELVRGEAHLLGIRRSRGGTVGADAPC